MEPMQQYNASLQPYIENCSRAITYPSFIKDTGGSLTIQGAQWALQVCTGPNSLPLVDTLYGVELSARTEDTAFNVSSFVYESKKRGFWGLRSSYQIQPITYLPPITSLEKASHFMFPRSDMGSSELSIGEKTYD